MSALKSALLRSAAGAFCLVLAYSTLLKFPQPLFSFTVSANNLTLHSDRALAEGASRRVLELAEAKLRRSPLYSKQIARDIYLCNSTWRQAVFFSFDYGVGGVAPYPRTPNVFLRDADVERNRLISPSGSPVAGSRTLDYFIAHEVTHQLTGRAVGPIRYFRMAQWIREGYADYVGKGASFNYAEARRAFDVEAPEMDWKKSGLYWRYHLLVAYLLDRRGWSVMRLLEDPPSQESVESAIREERQ